METASIFTATDARLRLHEHQNQALRHSTNVLRASTTSAPRGTAVYEIEIELGARTGEGSVNG
jgi:hypothetical protein